MWSTFFRNAGFDEKTTMNEYQLSKSQVYFLATWFTKGHDEAVKGTPPDIEYCLEELDLRYRYPNDPGFITDDQFVRLIRLDCGEVQVTYMVEARSLVDERWKHVADVNLDVNGSHYQFEPTNLWTMLRPEWFAFKRGCVFRLAHRLHGSGHNGALWGEVLHRFCVNLLHWSGFPSRYPDTG